MGVGPPPPKPPEHGPLYVNIANDTRYSAAIAAGIGQSGVDLGPTIQQAIDNLGAKIGAAAGSSNDRGTIFFPAAAGSYYISSTIEFDSNCIKLKGEGESTVIQARPGFAIQMLRIGFPRAATTTGGANLAVTSAYRPTLTGVLDGSFTGFGFRTNGVSSLSFEAGSPLTLGQNSTTYGSGYADNWNETNQFTFEFAWKNYNNGGDILGGMPLITCGDPTNGRGGCKFFTLYVAGTNSLNLSIGTRATQFAPVTSTLTGAFAITSATLHRTTIQLDLVGGHYYVFDNGLCVAAGAMPTGGHFAANDNNPFLVFDTGIPAVHWGTPNGFDMGLFGLSASVGLKYNGVAVGQPQILTSTGFAPSDAQRYAPPPSGPGSDPNLLCYMSMTDSPTSGTRQLRVNGGPKAAGYVTQATICHALMNEIASSYGSQCAIEDMKFIGASLYGTNICFGSPLNTHIKNVISNNAAYAIGSINLQSNYIQFFDDCSLSATEAAFYSFNQTTFILRLQVQNPGRVGLRLVGSAAEIDGLNCASTNPNTEYILSNDLGDFGGLLSVKHSVLDNESSAPFLGIYRLQPCPNAFMTTCSFEQIYLAVQHGLRIFDVQGSFGGNIALTIDHLQSGDATATGPIVSSDTGLLKGHLANFACGPTAVRFEQRTAGQRSKFEVHEVDYYAPPRALAWTPETTIHASYAALGNYAWQKCATPGVGDAAVWVGGGLMISRPTDLGCYFRIGTSFLGTGTAFWVGLLLNGTELSGSSYARVQVLNTSGQVGTLAGGEKALMGPLVIAPVGPMTVILFAAFSGTLSANQVGIYTAGSGGSATQTTAIPGTEAAPRVILSGMSPTFAPGAFVTY